MLTKHSPKELKPFWILCEYFMLHNHLYDYEIWMSNNSVLSFLFSRKRNDYYPPKSFLGGFQCFCTIYDNNLRIDRRALSMFLNSSITSSSIEGKTSQSFKATLRKWRSLQSPMMYPCLHGYMFKSVYICKHICKHSHRNINRGGSFRPPDMLSRAVGHICTEPQQ